MKLRQYVAKRNLKQSKEPPTRVVRKKTSSLHFVVHEHHARRLHYDFRLQVKGVLKSWAIPKGPSVNPKIKRLAIMVEDHPLAYKDFQGIIPEGYGAGSVAIWDQGTYNIEEQPAKKTEHLILQGLKEGKIHFTLHGKKLQGDFYLVRLKTGKGNEWLFCKSKNRL